MLRLAVAFLVVALIAGLFSFGFVAGIALEAARMLFFIFLVLFVVSLLTGYWGGRGRAPNDFF
jgi:uncharacterized membrane protein YtjA (UPF0391 family)